MGKRKTKVLSPTTPSVTDKGFRDDIQRILSTAFETSEVSDDQIRVTRSKTSTGTVMDWITEATQELNRLAPLARIRFTTAITPRGMLTPNVSLVVKYVPRTFVEATVKRKVTASVIDCYLMLPCGDPLVLDVLRDSGYSSLKRYLKLTGFSPSTLYPYEPAVIDDEAAAKSVVMAQVGLMVAGEPKLVSMPYYNQGGNKYCLSEDLSQAGFN